MFGEHNPFPMQFGGGPTQAEQAYSQIRHSMGVGGSAPDDSGIDGLWRSSRALGLDAAESSGERALMQAFPQCATDLLEYYERLLLVTPPAGSTEEQRRLVVAQRFYELATVGTAELDQALKAIDPRLALYDAPASLAIETMLGARAFEAHDPADEGPPFNYLGGAGFTEWPAFNTHQRVRVRFTLGYDGAPSVADQKVIARAKARLRLILPSDTDFAFSVGPWVVGLTPIGLGAVA